MIDQDLEQIIFKCKPHPLGFIKKGLVILIVFNIIFFPSPFIALFFLPDLIRKGETMIFLSFFITYFVLQLLILYLSYLIYKNREYIFTAEKLYIKKGFLNKRQDILELCKIKDLVIEKPFFLKKSGLGVIILYTSDTTDSIVKLYGIENYEQISEIIKQKIKS